MTTKEAYLVAISLFLIVSPFLLLWSLLGYLSPVDIWELLIILFFSSLEAAFAWLFAAALLDDMIRPRQQE